MHSAKIAQLAEYGQSVWLDQISRSLIDSGRLQELIDMGLRGLTSNPTIFDRAIRGSADYDDFIIGLCKKTSDVFSIYDDVTIRDIQAAADLFKPVYDATEKHDGYVSLEINPQLADDTEATIEEGLRLHKKVNRPNLMLKVPSTDAGFPAVEALLAEGINVNVTLIFSPEQYSKTAHAFLNGMAKCAQNRDDLSAVRSVASVFVSRIDTAVDKMLDEKLAEESDEKNKETLTSLKGKAAVANSVIIFDKSLEIFASDQFKTLAAKGASLQRVLFGSTSSKNPAYSPIKYVEELIGKETVNTMPEKTLVAFEEQGTVKEALPGDVDAARNLMKTLAGFDIDINDVNAKLLKAGVESFIASFDALLASVKEKVDKVCGT